MTRRLLYSGTALALAIGAAVAIVPAQAAARGAACTLNGSATISPGLTTKAQFQTVTLSNVRLGNCKAGSTGKPGVPPALTATVDVPPVTTTASCATGKLALTATINWSNGTTTTTTINTTGLAASQTIKGNVTGGDNPYLSPGDIVAGEAAFKPTTTAQNCAKVAVTAVTFSGALGAGSPK